MQRHSWSRLTDPDTFGFWLLKTQSSEGTAGHSNREELRLYLIVAVKLNHRRCSEPSCPTTTPTGWELRHSHPQAFTKELCLQSSALLSCFSSMRQQKRERLTVISELARGAYMRSRKEKRMRNAVDNQVLPSNEEEKTLWTVFLTMHESSLT